MIKKYQYIYLILILLLLTNLALLAFYFFPNLNYLSIRSSLLRKGSFLRLLKLNKDFFYDLSSNNSSDTLSNVFNLKTGEFLINKPDHNKFLLGTVWLRGIIEKEPYIDPNTGFIIFKVRYNNQKAPITSDVVLGKDNYSISTLIANNGIIERESWGIKKVLDIKNLLKKGDPVIMNLYFSRDLEVFKNRPGCDEKCLNSWKIVIDNFLATESLLNSLDNQNIKAVGLIGPVRELILYDKE